MCSGFLTNLLSELRCSLIEIHITNGLLTVNAKKKMFNNNSNRGGGLEKRGEAVNVKGED